MQRARGLARRASLRRVKLMSLLARAERVAFLSSPGKIRADGDDLPARIDRFESETGRA